MTFRDIVVAEAEAKKQVEPVREFTLATVREVSGSIVYPHQPSFNWVQEWAQEQSIFGILNLRMNVVDGLQVMIGYPEKPPYTRQILGVWSGIVNLPGYTPDDGQPYTVPPHHVTHEYQSEASPGNDAVRTFLPAIQPLKSMPLVRTVTTNITVQPLRYWSTANNFKQFPGFTVNIASFFTGLLSGSSKYILIYLDRSSNNIVVVDGVVVSSPLTPPLPDLPIYGIASAFIRLTGGILGVLESDIEDARGLLTGTAALPTPSQNGDILIADNGQFVVGKPVTNDDGAILIDSSGGIIYV